LRHTSKDSCRRLRCAKLSRQDEKQERNGADFERNLARRLGKAFKVGQQEAGRRFDLERESAQLCSELFKVGEQGEIEVRRADKSLEVVWKTQRREMGFYKDCSLYTSFFEGLYTFCEHLKQSLK
jgi:hypothetical protein